MIIVSTADVFSMVSCTCGMMDEPEIKDINMKQYRSGQHCIEEVQK